MKTTSSRFNYKSYALFFSSLNYHSNVDSNPSEPNKTGQRNCWGICLREYVVGTSRFRQVVTQVDPQRQRKPRQNGNLSLLLSASVVLFGSREILFKCSTKSNEEMD